MKKYLLLVVLLGVTILTGCIFGTQTVECELTNEESGYTMKQKIEVVIKGTKADKETMEIITTPASNADVFLPTYKEGLDASFSKIKDAKGIEYTSEIKGDTHTLKMVIDFKKLDDKEIEKFSSNEKQIVSDKDVKNASAKLTKENFEKQGFTCKIK